jgi:hypothetical protein
MSGLGRIERAWTRSRSILPFFVDVNDGEWLTARSASAAALNRFRFFPLNFYAACGEVVHRAFTTSLVAVTPRWERAGNNFPTWRREHREGMIS